MRTSFDICYALTTESWPKLHTFKEVVDMENGIYYEMLDDVYVHVKARFLGGCGITYKADGTLLKGWCNGRQQFYNKVLAGEYSNVIQLTSPPLPDKIYEDETICILARMWGHNYTHFTLEIMDKLLFAESIGFRGRYMLFHSSFAEEFLRLFGIDEKRILWISAEDDDKILFVKHALEIEGFTLGSDKGLPTLENYVKDMKPLCTSIQTYPARLYVKRIGRRKLLGIDDILASFGFETMIPEEHTVAEEAEYFRHADVVFLPHGAAMANTIFMRKGTAIIETFPANWTNLMTIHVAHYKAINYRMLVESCLGNNQKNPQVDDYTISRLLVQHTLEEYAVS